MNERILTAAGIAVLAIGVTTACGVWKRDDPNRIKVSGNIELTQVDIAFKVPGKLAELLVAEGDPVQKGQVIARLDREQTQRQRSRDQAGVVSAQTQLAQLVTGIQYQRATVEGDIALRQAELQQAEARLAELEHGARPQEIQQAQSAADEARTQHEQAAQDWQRAQTLYKNDDISTAQRDQFKARYDATAATLRRAEEQLGLVKEGPRKEEIDAARAQVARGKAALRLAEASRLELRRREQELDTRRAEIERAKAQVSIVDSQLEDTVAVSPINGVILVKPAEAGEILAAGTTIVTVGDLDHPWLRGYISEQNLGRVKRGTKARVTSDSYPGKAYWGRVSFIASEAEFTPKQIQTPEERVKLVYRIKIDLDNPAHELKSNMPVEAELVLNEK